MFEETDMTNITMAKFVVHVNDKHKDKNHQSITDGMANSMLNNVARSDRVLRKCAHRLHHARQQSGVAKQEPNICRKDHDK